MKKSNIRSRFTGTLQDIYVHNRKLYAVIKRPVNTSTNQVLRQHAHVEVPNRYLSRMLQNKLGTKVSFVATVYGYSKVVSHNGFQKRQQSLCDTKDWEFEDMSPRDNVGLGAILDYLFIKYGYMKTVTLQQLQEAVEFLMEN